MFEESHTYLQTTSFLLVFMSVYIEIGLRLLHIWLQLDNTTVSFVGGMHSMGRENGQIYNTAGVIPNVETRDGSCPSTLQSRQCQACPSNAE
jgi:hypothetical protein